MSGANKRQVAMLVMCSACLVHLDDYFEVNVIQKYITEAKENIDNTIISWPHSGNKKKNFEWIDRKLREFDKVVQDIPQDWNITAISFIALQICADLFSSINDKSKLRLLEPMFIPLQRINDFVDQGKNIELYKDLTNIVDEFYILIEFTKHKEG